MCTTHGNQNEDHFGALQDRIQNIMNRLDRRFHIKEKIDDVVQLAKANPQAAVIVGVTAAVCFLPVLGFAVFVFLTSLIGLMGFVVIEGFLVSIGAVILLGILAILASVSVATSGLAVLAWVLAKHGRSGVQQFLGQLSSDGSGPTEVPKADVVGPREKPVDKEA